MFVKDKPEPSDWQRERMLTNIVFGVVVFVAVAVVVAFVVWAKWPR